MRTLIVYTSKHGSTEKCVGILKSKLKGEVTSLDIKKDTIKNIEGFDNIIIGGSVYVGKIQKEVSDFCSNNLSLLLKKKVGLFMCCMNKKEIESAFNASFPKDLLESAAVKETFGGEFNFKDMNFFEKTITKVISKVLAKEDPSIKKLDTKNDISLIEYNNIDKFVKSINN